MMGGSAVGVIFAIGGLAFLWLLWRVAGWVVGLIWPDKK